MHDVLFSLGLIFINDVDGSFLFKPSFYFGRVLSISSKIRVCHTGLRKVMMLYHENMRDKRHIFESSETVCFVHMKQELILFICTLRFTPLSFIFYLYLFETTRPAPLLSLAVNTETPYTEV